MSGATQAPKRMAEAGTHLLQSPALGLWEDKCKPHQCKYSHSGKKIVGSEAKTLLEVREGEGDDEVERPVEARGYAHPCTSEPERIDLWIIDPRYRAYARLKRYQVQNQPNQNNGRISCFAILGSEENIRLHGVIIGVASAKNGLGLLGGGRPHPRNTAPLSLAIS